MLLKKSFKKFSNKEKIKADNESLFLKEIDESKKDIKKYLETN